MARYELDKNCVVQITKIKENKDKNRTEIELNGGEVRKTTYCVDVVEINGLIAVLIRDFVRGREIYIPPESEEPQITLFKPLPQYLFKYFPGLENLVRQ